MRSRNYLLHHRTDRDRNDPFFGDRDPFTIIWPRKGSKIHSRSPGFGKKDRRSDHDRDHFPILFRSLDVLIMVLLDYISKTDMKQI